MLQERLQAQRFEYKYVISEDTAAAVRDFVRSYLRPDEYAAVRPDFSYPVHSLYLDSVPLTTYWDTINGNLNRYKLRLRFYSAHPESPVFFEIKQRVNDAVLKQRSGVRREAVAWLLSGHLPNVSQLISGNPNQLAALDQFCLRMNRIGAVPQARVSYQREAWAGEGKHGIRVTMDRAVRLEPDSTARLAEEMRNPVEVFGQNVVLELKFDDQYPDWVNEMVRVFGLVRGSAAKYVDGVALIGEERVTGFRHQTFDPRDEEHLNVRRQALAT